MARYIGVASVVGLLFGVASLAPVRAQQVPYAPVAKAPCGPGSQPEGGLQGLMTGAERFSAPRPYNCNLEVVGQYPSDGLSWGGAALDSCAYVDKNSGPIHGKDGPSPKTAGTEVIDVSDPKHPKAVAYLSDPGMLEPNESPAAHAGRKLLAGIDPYYVYDDARTATRDDSTVAIYDVSICRRPVLKGSLKLSHVRSHGAYFAPDGRTFYVTSFTGNTPYTDKTPANDKWRANTDAIIAIDVSDPAHPKELVRWMIPPDVGAAHNVSISMDGNRAYLSLFGKQIGARADIPEAYGLAIVDVGEVQARKPNPKLTYLGRVTVPDSGLFQGNWEVRIKGQPYVLGAGGGGRGNCAPNASTAGGYVGVFDLRDAKNPKLLSRLILDSSLPTNCSQVTKDPINKGVSGGPAFCAVDDPNDARMVACGYSNAGLRVFDIRDPLRPREIGYYKPPARTEKPKPGSYYNLRWAQERHLPGEGARPDHVPRALAIRRDRGEIWFMSHENGFYVVRFTDAFRKAEPGLF